MNPSASPAVGRARLAPNLTHAFGGVWRLTSRQYFALNQWFTFFGPSALLGVLILATVHHRQGTNFFQLIGGFYLAFLVPVLAFISGAGAIRDELKFVDYLVTRPLPRPAFIVFKYLAHTACIELGYLFVFGVLMTLGVSREIQGLREAMPFLFLGQFLEIAAFVALGMLCGVLSSRYLVIGLAYGATIEVGISVIPTQLNRLSMTHQIHLLIEPILKGQGAFQISITNAFGTAAIILVFITVMVTSAALIFSQQQLEGAQSKEG